MRYLVFFRSIQLHFFVPGGGSGCGGAAGAAAAVVVAAVATPGPVWEAAWDASVWEALCPLLLAPGTVPGRANGRTDRHPVRSQNRRQLHPALVVRVDLPRGPISSHGC